MQISFQIPVITRLTSTMAPNCPAKRIVAAFILYQTTLRYENSRLIGGSGFIGSYLTKKFLTETYFTPELTEENYSVRVSATDISKTEKYLHLLSFPNSKNLEIIPLDFGDETDLLAFITGCDILVQCGTPYQLDFDDTQTKLFEKTIKWTENLLKIACHTPRLTKLIFVSAVCQDSNLPLGGGRQSDYECFSETDSQILSDDNDPHNFSQYSADQIIRRYITEHPDNEIEIITLSSGLVTGKALSAREDFTSPGLQFLIKNKIVHHPFMKRLFEQDMLLTVLDVNDMAEGVYKAAVIPGLHGKHYRLYGERWSISDISLMLNNQQPTGTVSKTKSGELAMKDLNMNFKPAKISLSEYASISENQFQE